ncbi:unnamed protein product, partial [Pylaiella littoralis]
YFSSNRFRGRDKTGTNISPLLVRYDSGDERSQPTDRIEQKTHVRGGCSSLDGVNPGQILSRFIPVRRSGGPHRDPNSRPADGAPPLLNHYHYRRCRLPGT